MRWFPQWRHYVRIRGGDGDVIENTQEKSEILACSEARRALRSRNETRGRVQEVEDDTKQLFDCMIERHEVRGRKDCVDRFLQRYQGVRLA